MVHASERDEREHGLQLGTAPQAILAAAVIAGIAALMAPVPTNQAPTPIPAHGA